MSTNCRLAFIPIIIFVDYLNVDGVSAPEKFDKLQWVVIVKMTSLVTSLVVVCGTFMLNLSCGGEKNSPPPQVAPSISVQLINQEVSIGASATFIIVAEGSAPLFYKWKWNGIVINGETNPTYTTPQLVPSDNLSKLTVTVSNDNGSITSAQATLSVSGGPRPPNFGDIRFKFVDAFPIPLQINQSTNIIGGYAIKFSNLLGSSLEIGGPGANIPLDMSWNIALFNLPVGIYGYNTIYQSGYLNNFKLDLSLLNDPKSVITSLDFCAAPNAYAWELMQAPSGDSYSLGTKTLLIGDLRAAAAQEGILSRVITAISFDSGLVTFVSYGSQGDTGTVYETQVELATPNTIGSIAATLAQSGYIITAIGGNAVDGFFLVGTRVKGDVVPRPFVTWSRNGTTVVGRGYAFVGHVYLPDPSNPYVGTDLWLLEQ